MYRNIALMSVSLFYRGKFYLPIRLIPLHTHTCKKNRRSTSHTFLYLLCLFPEPQSEGDLEWLNKRDCFYCAISFLLFKFCIYPHVLLQIFTNTLLENYQQHCNVFPLYGALFHTIFSDQEMVL